MDSMAAIVVDILSLNTDTAANNRHLFIFKAELCSQVECKVIIAEQVK